MWLLQGDSRSRLHKRKVKQVQPMWLHVSEKYHFTKQTFGASLFVCHQPDLRTVHTAVMRESGVANVSALAVDGVIDGVCSSSQWIPTFGFVFVVPGCSIVVLPADLPARRSPASKLGADLALKLLLLPQLSAEKLRIGGVSCVKVKTDENI